MTDADLRARVEKIGYSLTPVPGQARDAAAEHKDAARRATVEYIAWYNGTRLHSTLGYMTPDELETATNKEVVKQVA